MKNSNNTNGKVTRTLGRSLAKPLGIATPAPRQERKEAEPIVCQSDYGPIIILNPDSQYKFQFGPGKAAMILKNIKAIEEFAKQYPVEKRS